jgi:hypothetical protein
MSKQTNDNHKHLYRVRASRSESLASQHMMVVTPGRRLLSKQALMEKHCKTAYGWKSPVMSCGMQLPVGLRIWRQAG